MAGFDDALDDLTRACMDEFQNRKFIHVGNSGETAFEGIYDHNHHTIDVVDGMSVSTFKPVIKAHQKDFPSPVRIGDVIRGGSGETFTVEDAQPDSGFGLIIFLHVED